MFFGAKIKNKKKKKREKYPTKIPIHRVGLRVHSSSRFGFFSFSSRESGFIRLKTIASHCFRDIGGENAIIGTENGNRAGV